MDLMKRRGRKSFYRVLGGRCSWKVAFSRAGTFFFYKCKKVSISNGNAGEGSKPDITQWGLLMCKPQRDRGALAVWEFLNRKNQAILEKLRHLHTKKDPGFGTKRFEGRSKPQASHNARSASVLKEQLTKNRNSRHHIKLKRHHNSLVRIPLSHM